MSIRGHAENGVIVLDEAIDLANGTPVIIELAVDASGLSPRLKAGGVASPQTSESLSAEIRRFTGILPPDVDVEAAMHELERFSAE